MNKQQQEVHLKAFTERMATILLSKGDDYANEDRLSNFKLAGTICGLKPEQNCLSLIATKVARLGALFQSGNTPNNESIRDSIIDLANYAALLDMIVDDGDNAKEPFTIGSPPGMVCGNCKFFRMSPHKVIAPIENMRADGVCENENQGMQPIILDSKTDTCRFHRLK